MKTTVLFALAVVTFAVPAVCLASNSIVPVPEPATGLLLLAGGAGAAAYRKFRKRSR
jgi:PEP-CTERM motif